MLKVAIAILVLIGMQSFAEAGQNKPSPNLPPDVAGFIARRTSCLDWISKFQNGLDTAADFEKTLSVLRCDAISADQLRLRQQYALQPEVIAALDHHWIKVVRRIPVPASTLPR
jgi:hypothetical protein